MDDLFLLLMLLSFAAFIIALINPTVFQKIFKSKATRKNLSVYFITSTIIFFLLFGITASLVEKTKEIETLKEDSLKEQNTGNTKEKKEVGKIKEEQPIISSEKQKDKVDLAEKQVEIINNEKPSNIKTLEATPSPNKKETNDIQSLTPPEIESEPVITKETIEQENAIKKAKTYIGYSAFSYNGLIDQLKYEQFSPYNATYGADNSGADWNEQAAKKAKSYMEYSDFSHNSLIEQLKYNKFTQPQAEYGANAIDL